jgi:hypothetical protein
MGLEIRKLSTLSYPPFLWKTALVDTKNVLISTYQFSKLSNQSTLFHTIAVHIPCFLLFDCIVLPGLQSQQEML